MKIADQAQIWWGCGRRPLDFSRPGKPTDNAFIEAFSGRSRSECLNAHWFLTLADAMEKMEDCSNDYNQVWPHGAIGNVPPVALMTAGSASNPLPERAQKL